MSLTKEQLRERKSGLGGSEIAAVVGLSPWKTAADVYSDKLSPELPPQDDSWPKLFGSRVERVLLGVLSCEPQHIIPPPPVQPMRVDAPGVTLWHPEPGFEWMLATPDAEAVFPGGAPPVLVEVKTSAAKKIQGWGAAGTDEVPAHVVAQCLWTMFVMRACGRPVEQAWVLVMFGTREPQLFFIPYDAGRAEWLVEQGRKFWTEHVLKKVPPTQEIAA